MTCTKQAAFGKSDTYALSSVISYLRNGSYEIYKSYPLIVQANKGLVTLKTDILASLQGLAVTGKDTAKLAKIIGAYAKMIDKSVFTGQQVDKVIRELLVLAITEGSRRFAMKLEEDEELSNMVEKLIRGLGK